MTEQANHTPGPWRVEPKQPGQDFNEDVFDSKGTFIADCQGRNFREMKAVSLEERKANARLIAAAPEMAEVLADFYKFLAQISAGPSTAAFQKRICAVLQKAGASAALPSFEDVRGILGAPEEED